MRPRIFAIAALILALAALAHAGGPAFVAGAGYNTGVEGQPILWANASIQYFTDQGSLSPILSNSQADAFVASAIAPWTTAPGVALTVTQAGHLAEDVNGSNIEASFGVISAPADVTPQATSTPLGIIYDYDGSVTDAILGQGAGGSGDCFTNAVYGGPDNFSPSGNLAHAVIVINGVCATTSAQLPDVQYRLVRVLAYCFGLGWSQANVNVLTGHPAPTQADFQGFPVMHFLDPIDCVPISSCYGGIFEGALGKFTVTPALDDVTALARLYPTPSGAPPTGRIWGNVYFTDSSGNAAQFMQGVNVVARLMSGGQPSRQYVVTSVSGFDFLGNAGNIIDGYFDANGLPYNRFGNGDPTVEGFYDLGQLTIPTGQTIAQYQLTVEPLNPNWSWGIEPYGPTQVAPSGSFAPLVVTIQSGSNVENDVLMLGSEIAGADLAAGSSYTNPVPLPSGGGWRSWISGYGSTDFFYFNAQINRTASIALTALDESGNPTESKLLPVAGMWELPDETGNPAPASTPSAFNTQTFAMTRLDAQFFVSEAYKVGVADYRGDGRPDYAYKAYFLYSDTVSPARLSLAGGVATLQGIGFIPGLQVSATTTGTQNGIVLNQLSGQLQISLPSATLDGPATIQVTEPVTGSFSQMIGALTYGASSTDLIQLLQGGAQTTPVGAQAPNLLRVRATASDGVTPVNGATVAWSSTNGAEFSACNQATSCSVLTDASGEASTYITPAALGQAAITAALAPASYQPPQTVQATLTGTETSLDLVALSPTRSIAKGATLTVPLTVATLDMGAPLPNIGIKFTVTNGAASLSSSTATTNSAGLATITAQLTNLAAMVQVSACVLPGNTECQIFSLLAIQPSSWTLEPVSGASQIVPGGQSFQPLVMRVTDGSSADNPVIAATVNFLTTLERNPSGPGGPPPGGDFQSGESRIGDSPAQSGMPVILATSQAQVVADQNGFAQITPSATNQTPCDVDLTVTAGRATAQFQLESVDPITVQQQQVKKRGKEVSRRTDPGSSAPTQPDLSETPEIFAVPQAAVFFSDSTTPDPSPAQDDPPAAEAPPDQAPSSETPPAKAPTADAITDTPVPPPTQSGSVNTPPLIPPTVAPASPPPHPDPDSMPKP